MVSKISWTHLRHRCCLSEIGGACCLFGCIWSRGFCHSLGLFVLSCTVCLALCVCRPCRLACLSPLSFPSPPHLGVLLLVVVSWLFVGSKTSFTVAAISIRSTEGATGDERGGRQPPTPTQAIYYILYSLAHDTSDGNDQHSSCDVHGDCATSHALMSAVTVVRMNRPVDSFKTTDSFAKCLSRASNHRELSRLRRSSL